MIPIMILTEIRTNVMMTKNVRTEQRGRSPLVVPRRGSVEDVTRTTNMKRSQSIENLHQKGPKQELMKPILQQNLTVFDGKCICDFFHILLKDLEHSHGCRSRSKERSSPLKIHQQHEIQQFSSQFVDPNRYNSPISSHPILNRVHEPHNSSEAQRTECEKSDEKKRRNSKIMEEKIRPPSRGRSATKNSKEKQKNHQKHSPSSKRPTVPPPSVFVRPKSSKSVKDEVLLVLPVQYTLPSQEVSNSFTSIQHGVMVLHSETTLQELTSRLQDQFDLPKSFDIVLSQRNLENCNHSNTSPVVQVP